MNEQFVGYTGCFFLSIFLVPQVYKTCKTHNVDGLSPQFLGISMLANVLMMYYSIRIQAIPVLIANGSVFTNSAMLMVLYFRYRNVANQIEEPDIEL